MFSRTVAGFLALIMCVIYVDRAIAELTEEEKAKGFVEIFNGKDLTGWKLRHEKAKSGWTVTDGIMDNEQAGSDIVTEEKFMDFELHIEFKVPPHGNSGVYLQGRYEVQVHDSYGQGIRGYVCGAIYSKILPKVNASKKAGEWQSFDVAFYAARLDDQGKVTKKARVTVIHNGQKIIDNVEINGCTGGAIDGKEGLPGPIMLQGDHGPIQYRNIKIRKIKGNK